VVLQEIRCVEMATAVTNSTSGPTVLAPNRIGLTAPAECKKRISRTRPGQWRLIGVAPKTVRFLRVFVGFSRGRLNK